MGIAAAVLCQRIKSISLEGILTIMQTAYFHLRIHPALPMKSGIVADSAHE
jgi:hypothetical protein